MSVRSRSAARKVALSVRASRIVDSRDFARGWSTTRTSMVDTVEPPYLSGPVRCFVRPAPRQAVAAGPSAVLQDMVPGSRGREAQQRDLVDGCGAAQGTAAQQ